MKKKHILVISQYFYPEQFRINDICTEWIKRGYQVTVITGIPNYPEGKFYEGYDLCHKREEEYNGISIKRLAQIPRGRRSITLALNYLSFILTGGLWSITTKIKADYVFVFGLSPITQALPAVWFAKRGHIPCYLFVQDLWPDSVEIITGIHNRLIIGALDRMVQYIYKRCERIFVTSNSFQRELVQRNVPKKKVVFWPQYAEDCYQPIVKDNHQKFTVIFTGNIGYAQGLEVLPKTAKLLEKEEIGFLLVGDGRYRKRLQEEIELLGVTDKFHFVGRIAPEQVPIYLAKADVAFISFKDSPLFAKTIPAKLQSYMACGMPILAAAGGETKEIVETARCGICSPSGNAEELARTIREMKTKDLKMMGENALIYSRAMFNKEKLLDFMDSYFMG